MRPRTGPLTLFERLEKMIELGGDHAPHLVRSDLARVASPWHTDLDLGRPIEVMTDMAASRKLGFSAYQNTQEAFLDLFTTLRADKVIP